MSFVNLFANDVWTELDILARTEAELHSVISVADELIFSRKMIAFSLGKLAPTADEQAQLDTYEAAAYSAQQSGIAARADMARLRLAMEYEAALAVLALGPDEAAQAVIDGASPDTVELVALRNPPAVDGPDEAAQAVIDAVSPDAVELAEPQNPPAAEPAQ